MILKLSDNYICDNSLECEKNCYFVLTKSNEKFLADAKAKGAQIITPAKAYELAKIPKDLLFEARFPSLLLLHPVLPFLSFPLQFL